MIIYWLRHRGTFFPVHQGDCLLGRSPECLIVLPSEQVSREHAVVRRIHCGLEIEDLGSRNGTWVNGERIRRPTVLSAGDEVKLGEEVLEVVLKPNARAPVTVSKASATLAEESDRQRRALDQLEYALARRAHSADRPQAAVELRDEIERLIESAGPWGIVLSPEETARLHRVAQTLSAWVADARFASWSRDLSQRLSGRGPPTA